MYSWYRQVFSRVKHNYDKKLLMYQANDWFSMHKSSLQLSASLPVAVIESLRSGLNHYSRQCHLFLRDAQDIVEQRTKM